jgi:hypothetical protein
MSDGAAIGLSRCANCGAPVASRYCGECGQRVEHLTHSIGHFLREAVEDLTHADSRLWRTLLNLLARPGYLTCELLAGRRARYLPPLRLYLVLSLAFFLIAESGPSRLAIVSVGTGGEVLTTLRGHSASGTAGNRAPDADAQHIEQVCAQVRIEGPLAGLLDAQRVRAACRRTLVDDGRALQAAVLRYLPRAMFVFLPLIALVMKLLYRRPCRFYIEHLLFLLHDHAFVFLLFGLCGLIALTPADAVGPPLYAAAAIYTAWYLYRSMRRVYGDGRLLTAAKLCVLGFSYLAGALLMLAITSLYSLETLGVAAG